MSRVLGIGGGKGGGAEKKGGVGLVIVPVDLFYIVRCEFTCVCLCVCVWFEGGERWEIDRRNLRFRSSWKKMMLWIEGMKTRIKRHHNPKFDRSINPALQLSPPNLS